MVGVVIFGAVFVLCFTWIMFFYAMHRNYKEYDEFLQVYFLSMCSCKIINRLGIVSCNMTTLVRTTYNHDVVCIMWSAVAYPDGCTGCSSTPLGS